MENDPFIEKRKTIKNFNLQLSTKVIKTTINNKSQTQSLYLEFEYTDHKRIYNLNFFEITNALNINKLNFEDISTNLWENINWHITDRDDDGDILLSFYCKDIHLTHIH